MRIYHKLIIAFLILSVIPLLFIGVVSFYNTRNSLTKAIISNLHNAADDGADEFIVLTRSKSAMKDMLERLNSNLHLGKSGRITFIKKKSNGQKRGSERSVDYRGKAVLSAWRQVKSLDWAVAAKIDECEALLPVDRLRNLLFATMVVVIILIVFTALIIARSISDPIDKLRKGAKIVGLGNLDYSVGVDSEDEVGQLSRAFDAMSQNLKRTTISVFHLNKEVAEREKMLKWQQDVNGLQQSLLAPVALDKKLKMITDGVSRIFDADFCRIWLIQQGDRCALGCLHAQTKEGPHICRYRDKCLHLTASSGRYTHIDGKEHSRVPFDCYKIGRIASGEDHKFLTNDVANDPSVHHHEWARELGLVSFAGYQLRTQKRGPIGVLAIFSKNPILPAQDAILDSFSTTTAFVIQQAIANNNLLKKAVELARNVEELKFSQNMLIQSEKMASLGKLVSEISHEINNPLMIISGNAQLSLMSEELNARTKETMELIMKECQRAKEIIRRVLRFAKPSKGEAKEIDICQSIDTVVSMVEKQFKTAGVEIKRVYLKNPPSVSIDEQQLQEVVMNFLNNAKDAMPDGGTITITTSLESGKMRMDFKDSGSGMSEEVKQSVLEPFFTTKSEGTGLGLSICYGIIKAHNGELKFESQLGKGTTFTVLLPLVKAASI